MPGGSCASYAVRLVERDLVDTGPVRETALEVMPCLAAATSRATSKGPPRPPASSLTHPGARRRCRARRRAAAASRRPPPPRTRHLAVRRRARRRRPRSRHRASTARCGHQPLGERAGLVRGQHGHRPERLDGRQAPHHRGTARHPVRPQGERHRDHGRKRLRIAATPRLTARIDASTSTTPRARPLSTRTTTHEQRGHHHELAGQDATAAAARAWGELGRRDERRDTAQAAVRRRSGRRSRSRVRGSPRCRPAPRRPRHGRPAPTHRSSPTRRPGALTTRPAPGPRAPRLPPRDGPGRLARLRRRHVHHDAVPTHARAGRGDPVSASTACWARTSCTTPITVFRTTTAAMIVAS